MARGILAYAWASPNSLVGLVIGGAMILLGAHARRIDGVLEIGGGLVGTLLGPTRIALPWRAMTLGHVIIGRDPDCLDCCRDHEQAHVRQVERWGPAFIPAYLIASGWAWARGRHYYLDNWFERDARRACGECW